MSGDVGLERLLLEQSEEVLLAVDPVTLRIAAANRKARELLRYPADELIGLPITELESAVADVFYWEEVAQGAAGDFSGVEGLYRLRDGELLPVVKDARRASRGGRDWLVLRVRDERRRLADESNLAELASRLAATIEATGDGLLVTDADGNIVSMNRRFAAMWELPEDVVLEGGDAIARWAERRLVAPAAWRQGMAAAALDSRGEGLDILELADGRFFERRAHPQMLDDRLVGRVYGFRDFTERVEYEKRLVQLREEAEQANRAKGAFLATMSHEVRTPLNGILGMAQLLLLPDSTEQERDEYARTILTSGQALLALLNDVLDYSKIEAGKVDLAQAAFDPRQIVEESVALFAGPARAKGLAMEAVWGGPPGLRYWADPIRLRQMLSNLVGNAVKFTATGFVRVTAAEVQRVGAEALLEFMVADSGIGVPAEKQPLLFKPFSQIDGSTTREYGGTGLGLSIVRSLAMAMGGDIGVDSEPGKGASFWFRVRARVLREGEESRQIERAATPLRSAGEKR